MTVKIYGIFSKVIKFSKFIIVMVAQLVNILKPTEL